MAAKNISDEVQARLVSIVIDNEYTTAKGNQKGAFDDFEAHIDLFDSVRTEKDYDWQSDIGIPEFASHMLTQAAIDAGAYFMTRDFVEVYVMDFHLLRQLGPTERIPLFYKCIDHGTV